MQDKFFTDQSLENRLPAAQIKLPRHGAGGRAKAYALLLRAQIITRKNHSRVRRLTQDRGSTARLGVSLEMRRHAKTTVEV